MLRMNDKLLLKGYTNANYVESVVDKKYATDHLLYLEGDLVIWRSKKQNIVARSNKKLEFRAMMQRVCELICLKRILEDFKIKWENLMCLYYDNKTTISIIRNLVQHGRTKHIEVTYILSKKNLTAPNIFLIHVHQFSTNRCVN